MTKIILFLQGKPYQQIDIDLLPYDSLLPFKVNVTMREYQLNHNIHQLKLMYGRQIDLVKNDYHVVVVFQSKMN